MSMTKADYISLVKMIGRDMLWEIPIMLITILVLNWAFWGYNPTEQTQVWLKEGLFMTIRFTVYLLPFTIFSGIKKIKRLEETKRNLEQYDGLYTDR